MNKSTAKDGHRTLPSQMRVVSKENNNRAINIKVEPSIQRHRSAKDHMTLLIDDGLG